MLINSSTIGATTGGVKIYLDGVEVFGVANLNTKDKYVECYVKDNKGHFIIIDDELQVECIPFEMATIRFDNVIIEVN
ncbi:hypothetical protein ROCKET24_61 [Vibrio phage Rocket24]|uniref:Uncharacterized protein n=2 Tax=Thalassavirus TaxID=2948922 RepID=A0A6G8R509_9CAUD|nr:hypothetical protein KNU88_gp062 [Vibrio phage Chester]YP_010114233.1 hypothetical protein KNV71_gp063 [Vibrio phage Gary]QIG66184.1 hypothetical protein CILSICK_63 [Vibrio phage Cilsick]QKN84530.1 hypothetical protein BBMUFFIN_64 [Vibrio phage BBMuffin]WBU77068.1 hypothetical protein NOELLE_62 [Vibrio phage Noelle]WCD55756.1 hypothetical protein ROCKET24_61 [Vibrio phage Rocket24]QIN96489.1 hypothetical protein CHESTER_62 [Vibrio phage Chester]